jgi:hypothetical protein
MKGCNLWWLIAWLDFTRPGRAAKTGKKKYAIEQEFLQALLMSELKMTW